MKLDQFIKKLQTIQKNLKKVNKKCNPIVVIDFDENGYYNLEKVNQEVDEEETVINLKSSNEL